MPSPWVALSARPHINLVRHQIAEPGRYYDESRSIVVRAGLLIEEERRHLWHEIRHADRRDVFGHTDDKVERLVERQAAEDAMPWVSLRWAWSRSTDLSECAWWLKLPEEWVAFRVRMLHPTRKAELRRLG